MNGRREQADLHDRLRGLRDAIDEVLATVNWSGFDPCDCGHPFASHRHVEARDRVREVCTIGDCPCVDFTQGDQAAREYERRARRDIDRQLEREARRRIEAEDAARVGRAA